MPVIKHDSEHKSVDKTVAKFNTTVSQTANDAKREHGSRQYAGAPKFDKSAQDYGRPLVGTKSQARGVRGGEHVMREVMFLCEMIEQNGDGTPPDCYIKFGPLFYMYSRISETLVGMLIRARKYGLVDFEGEMLYQRQDDHKKIRLLMSSEEINQSIEYTGDPVNIIKFNNGKMPPAPPPRAQLAPADASPAPVFSLCLTKQKQTDKPSADNEGTTNDKKHQMPNNPTTAPPNSQKTPKAVLSGQTPTSTVNNNNKMPNQTTPMPTNSKKSAEPIGMPTISNKTMPPVSKAGNKVATAPPPVFCLSFSAK